MGLAGFEQEFFNDLPVVYTFAFATCLRLPMHGFPHQFKRCSCACFLNDVKQKVKTSKIEIIHFNTLQPLIPEVGIRTIGTSTGEIGTGKLGLHWAKNATPGWSR